MHASVYKKAGPQSMLATHIAPSNHGTSSIGDGGHGPGTRGGTRPHDASRLDPQRRFSQVHVAFHVCVCAGCLANIYEFLGHAWF